MAASSREGTRAFGALALRRVLRDPDESACGRTGATRLSSSREGTRAFGALALRRVLRDPDESACGRTGALTRAFRPIAARGGQRLRTVVG